MSAPHGTKRRAADGSLDGEQRLSKRFDLLNLDSTKDGARLYIPVPSASDAAALPPSPSTPHPLAPNVPIKPKRPRAPTNTDSMQVEDTPHRVYIHDLAAELSDTDSDSEHPIFLSDIEKHLSQIPRHVLLGPPPKPTEHNQVVLYNVPASLTVPADQDEVRKAIIEARQRIRERQSNTGTESEASIEDTERSAGEKEVDDTDAMDLD